MAFPAGFAPKASLYHGAFCGSPLSRIERKDPTWEEAALQDAATKFLLFSTRKGSTGAAPFLLKERPLSPTIAWQTPASLGNLGIGDANLGIGAVGYSCQGVPPVLLGEHDGVAHFALLVDMSEEDLVAKGACPAGKKAFVAEGMGQLLMIGCDEGDFGIVGHAFAKIVWHKNALFCGACSKPSVSIECGAKRKCSDSACKNRMYARTDPSCMVLVRNPGNSKCLLISGQDKKNPAMWTCISGFVEQCEQVEEAAKREVLEEAGVEVDMAQGVSWLGSQPWPLGPGGKCELMLGLEMVAASESVTPNLSEILDARWFTREEAQTMLNTPYNQDGKAFVPSFISQAHFLLQRWVSRGALPAKAIAPPAPDPLLASLLKTNPRAADATTDDADEKRAADEVARLTMEAKVSAAEAAAMAAEERAATAEMEAMNAEGEAMAAEQKASLEQQNAARWEAKAKAAEAKAVAAIAGCVEKLKKAAEEKAAYCKDDSLPIAPPSPEA